MSPVFSKNELLDKHNISFMWKMFLESPKTPGIPMVLHFRGSGLK